MAYVYECVVYTCILPTIHVVVSLSVFRLFFCVSVKDCKFFLDLVASLAQTDICNLSVVGNATEYLIEYTSFNLLQPVNGKHMTS